MSKTSQKKRVAFILNNISSGGIEQFFINYLGHSNLSKKFNISVFYSGKCDPLVVKKIKQLNTSVVRTKHTFNKNRVGYFLEMTKLLKDFDLVHVNFQQNSFYALLAAKIAGVKSRIVHTHMNSDPGVQLKRSLLRRLVRKIKWSANERLSTLRLASSRIAGTTSFKQGFAIIYNAIDSQQFSYDAKVRNAMRQQLNLDKKTPLYGFFGRLHAEKNPLFAHQVFQSIRKKEPNARFIMIGYGSQSPLVHAAIKDDPAIIYVKSTDRIHDYYQAVDAIIFPSISEGLGMVAIEAQYNGTPILASDTIPEDTRISNYIKYINLERGADYWAKKAISLSKLQKGCAKYLPNSQNFDIESQFARLENIYTECIKNDSTKIPLNEREKNSRKNMISAFLVNTVSIIIGFISQRIFIQLLGSEYLGLNSLFANVLSMLSITELGLGTAIIFNLYKPVAEGSIDKIRSLMAFYRNSYHRIAAAISILGLFVVPLLPLIVKFDSAPSGINLYLVYVLFLLDSVLSYLFSYKRGILYAHQKTYLVNAIHIAYIILVNIFQLSFLFITKSYYLYLIIKIIFRLLENVAISIVANRKYKYLTEAGAAPIDAVTKRDIFKKIKALFLHQVGYFIVLGSDNVIISVFLGLTSVGLYANYYLVINSVYTVLSQFISAATPSIGNLLVTEAPEKRFETFNRLRQLNFWLSTLASIAIYVLIQPFITIWIGKDFLLPESVLLTLVIHFFIRSNRSVYASFKDAAGIYHEDRLIPVVESVINIIASVILVQIYGLAGVFIGTIISSLVIWCYSYPKFIYKNLLGRSYTKYVKETVAHVIIFAVLLFTAHVIISAG